MKRVAVTGAAGFVGANLTRRLLQDGHEVHLLIRPDHAMWRIDDIRDDVRMHTADLGDRQRVEDAIREIKPDWVFHLAAHGAYSWQTDLSEIVRTNILGTVNVAEADVLSVHGAEVRDPHADATTVLGLRPVRGASAARALAGGEGASIASPAISES